ncbi:MAG: PQQ-dependent sugar dehydrogenase [Proteobacteria bacterium]|nr:PQQ-dependent sugar dehydrogenase [Pseudomonadota bacterium]
MAGRRELFRDGGLAPEPFVDPTEDGIEDTLHRFMRVTRYSADPATGFRTADPASRKVLLGETWAQGAVAHSWFHLVGGLAFGRDGSLLVAYGDSDVFSSINDACYGLGRTPQNQNIGPLRAQSLDSYNGKILRIDPLTGLGYPSNPFYTGDADAIQSRIYALGLREPFRIGVVPGTGELDPSAGNPGEILISVVGWDTWEWLDVSTGGGENFGWPFWEANEEITDYPDNFFDPDRTFGDFSRPLAEDVEFPILAMNHQPDAAEPIQPPGVIGPGPLPYFNRCIIGGEYYQGGEYPADLVGNFFFGDCIWNNLYAAEFDSGGTLQRVKAVGEIILPFSQGFSLTAIRADALSGDLFLTALAGVYRLKWTGESPPPNSIGPGWSRYQ